MVLFEDVFLGCSCSLGVLMDEEGGRGRFCSRGCLHPAGRVKTRMVIALLLNLFLLMDFQLMTLIPRRIMELFH